MFLPSSNRFSNDDDDDDDDDDDLSSKFCKIKKNKYGVMKRHDISIGSVLTLPLFFLILFNFIKLSYLVPKL